MNILLYLITNTKVILAEKVCGFLFVKFVNLLHELKILFLLKILSRDIFAKQTFYIFIAKAILDQTQII